MTRGILDIEGVRLWVDTGVLRSILLTVLIGGGAVVLFRNDAGLALAALSFVPIVGVRASIARRSEEHPSELQPLMRISYAVFCLKKKTRTATYTSTTD